MKTEWEIDIKIKKVESGMIFITSEGPVPIFIAVKDLETGLKVFPEQFENNRKVAAERDAG